MENSDSIEINGISYKTDRLLKYDYDQIKEKNVYDDFRNANSTHIYFEFPELQNRKIILKQNHRLDKAGIFWDGSYLLIKYFLSLVPPTVDLKPEKKLRILELGGATSLPSIVAGICGHEAITTDLETVLKFMQENLDLNDGKNLSVTIKPLKWGDENHMKEIKGPFDYIFASELIYLEHLFEDLVKTMRYYCDEKTTILLDYRLRNQEKFEKFFALFDQYFDHAHLGPIEVKKYVPNPNMYILKAKIKKVESKEETKGEGESTA
jgi:predicted nicotinamide N-methyase